MVVAQPESGMAKGVQLGTHGGDATPLLGHAVDTGCSNDVRSRSRGEPDSVGVVHQQRFGVKLGGEYDGLAFAGMQACQCEAMGFRHIGNLANRKPGIQRGS